MKKTTTWIKFAIAFQLVKATLHSLSFFNEPLPANESESQLIQLMTTLHFNFGAGFTPTMQDLMNSFSISFSLLLIFGGALNWFLLLKNADPHLFKGVILMQVLIYGLCLVAMYILTFLIPVICIALIFIALLITYFTMPTYSTEKILINNIK